MPGQSSMFRSAHVCAYGNSTIYINSVDSRVMDNYQILGRIGEGAHGIVLKAKHIEVKCVYRNVVCV